MKEKIISRPFDLIQKPICCQKDVLQALESNVHRIVHFELRLNPIITVEIQIKFPYKYLKFNLS